MNKSETIESTFFSSFFGEYVQVMANIGTEPIEIHGFLLAKDDEFIYMGSTIERIDAVIRCNAIVMIQIDESGTMHPLIRDMNDPTSDLDFQ